MTRGRINEIQVQHYGEVKSDPEEMMSWLAFVKENRISGVARIRLPLSEPRKLALQGMVFMSIDPHVNSRAEDGGGELTRFLSLTPHMH